MLFGNGKKITAVVAVLALVVGFSAQADSFSSGSFTVQDPVIDSGVAASASSNFGLGQSLGQLSPGVSTSTSFQLWSGFQYFYAVSANVLTATSGDGQASLSWTVPAVYLGVQPGSYEVGVGTVSGSYVYQNVGNVTSFVKTGLSNGTTYYFKIKAKTAGGTFLVFSNEATAVPVGSVSSGGGGGGGGGGGATPAPSAGSSSLVINGTAYPSAKVTVLKDGVIAATGTASPIGEFRIEMDTLPAGNYSFVVFAADPNGQRSPPYSFSKTLADTVTSFVDNVFLGPTIKINYSEVRQGEPLDISGFSAPGASVTLYFKGEKEFTEQVAVQSDGFWTKRLSTDQLKAGLYTVKAKATKGSGSAYSEEIGFKVGAISVPVPTGQCSRSDLNCDGKVNITDFSILLFSWQAKVITNPKSDINKDGSVDLVDLSIMLFDWTG